MLRHDERIEHLINRKLDGELTDDDRLELDRALIRSPEHRRMLEESEAIDSLCAEMFQLEVGTGADSSNRTSQPSPALPMHSRGRQFWWLVPAALAACVAWFAFPVLMESSDGPPLVFGPGTKVVEDGGAASQRDRTPVAMRPSTLRRVGTQRSITDGHRDTGLYRVIGNDGRLYLIQLDHLRTLRRPARRSIERGSLSDL